MQNVLVVVQQLDCEVRKWLLLFDCGPVGFLLVPLSDSKYNSRYPYYSNSSLKERLSGVDFVCD